MGIHANAKLGPAGRRELVGLIRAGATERQAAACLAVAPATAHRWSVRERDATPEERANGRWALDASSRPHRSPRRTNDRLEQRICEVRERTGWGPRLIAGVVKAPHSTCHRVLERNGCSRRPRLPRENANSYEWDCPGDLLHIDVSSYARFSRPGHKMTGDRSTTAADKRAKVGYDVVHASVDDHSRLAFAVARDDEKAATVVAFVERALAFYDAHDITVRRILTDNAWTYTKNRGLHELLSARGIEHWTTRPYRPRTNGKVERFHQTMAREWAYGLTYNSSADRRRALPHWLEHYNQRRPHSALGGRSPISRAHNLSGQDS